MSYAVPARYLIEGLRGVGWEFLWLDLLALSVFGALVLTLASSRFRKQLVEEDRMMPNAKRRTLWVVRLGSHIERKTLNTPSLVGRFRGILALAVAVVAHLLATGQAQSLTVGLFAAPGYVSPTLEGSFEAGGLTLSARLKRDSLGLGVEDGLEFGPAGRLVFGARAEVGFGLQPLGWGAEAYLRGSVAQFGLDARLGYASAPRAALWAGERNFSGFAGNLNASYRLDPANTLRASLAYAGDVPGALFQGSTLGLEGSWALREEGATYLVGLGLRAGAYALLGWRGELGEEGTLLDATLRLGWVNRLELGLFQEELRLRLMTTFPLGGAPFEAAASLEAESLRGDVAYDNANGHWTVWLRYTFTFG